MSVCAWRFRAVFVIPDTHSLTGLYLGFTILSTFPLKYSTSCTGYVLWLLLQQDWAVPLLAARLCFSLTQTDLIQLALIFIPSVCVETFMGAEGECWNDKRFSSHSK